MPGNNKIIKKVVLVFLIILGVLGAWFFYHAYRGYKLYNSIFRLTKDEVANNLILAKPGCIKIPECELMPGDILIRRFVTPQTRDFDKYFDPFFTHSAFYLGEDEIFEATGDGEDKDNQIRVAKLSETDWFKENIENFVIVRPKNYHGGLDKISEELRKIADDPEYTFGFYDEQKKEASCSDVILKKLLENKVLPETVPFTKMVTPDYLFWAIERNTQNFEIIGLSLN